ncbi:hypothetical protein QE7_0311 [Clostridioides difficile CD92]|nr:hypothetical protein QE7_0311 [Clostridioides difficile CD92]
MLSKRISRICRHRPLMPSTPQRKRQSPACPTSSVAWCRNSSPDSRDVWKNGNSIGRISPISVWSFKRHKKQGRHSERLTDQRQRELPVPMSDQPQLQPFQSRVLKKRRKSNALPQRRLQKQMSQSRQRLSKSVPYLRVLLIGKRASLHSQYIGRM